MGQHKGDGMNKRDMALGLLAGLAGSSLMAASQASGAMTEADARAAVMGWLDALATDDPAAVARMLAPEFQILRADGSGYDRASYLANLPKFGGVPDITDMVFTSEGDLLVLRYKLRLEQKIADKPVQVLAPRLSVLRRVESVWLMVAHANFAQIG